MKEPLSLIRELKGAELRATATIMLEGKEGTDWSPYECDETWWTLRLYTRRN